jgi:hypothetical protein
MPKYNYNYILYLTDGQNKQRWPAFSKLTEQKAIERFKKRIFNERFNFPIARIYINNKLMHSFVQGVEVPVGKSGEKWYGPNISAFKLKMILLDGSFIGPFYSNSHLDIKMQHDTLISEYCKGKYNRKFISALIYYIQESQEQLATQIKYNINTNKYSINKNIKL